MSKFNAQQNEKNMKGLCTQKRGTHLQYVNNHNAKCENKGINTVGVTDYTKFN